MGAPFTTEERTRISHFLSYPKWEKLAQSLQLGFPATSQPEFMLDRAFDLVSPTARDTVRQDLCECEAIEAQLRDARSRYRAKKLDKLELNEDERWLLLQDMHYWTNRLADDLGVVRNPYSQAVFTGMGGGINASVV